MHKHVTLLALLAALQRKDKGFLYFETHAGRGAYDSRDAERGVAPQAHVDIEQLIHAAHTAPEIQQYTQAIGQLRQSMGRPRMYPGSPLLAAMQLRDQDRAVFVEIQPPEARALERELEALSLRRHKALLSVRCGDGYRELRAFLPPPERRGLVLIDPPYEETRQDFERASLCVEDALRRFATGTIMVWYPIKQERDTTAWLARMRERAGREVLIAELWLYPRDSRVSLNGSGLLIINPPYQVEERMRQWLPELYAHLAVGKDGGAAVRYN